MRYDALGRRAGCYDREEVYGETTTRFMTQLIKECAIGESEDSEVRKEDERRRRRAARMVVEVMAAIVAMEQEVRVKPQAKRAETAALPVPG